MPRLIHRVGSMIACNFRGRALLLVPDDFYNQVNRLLVDLPPLDQAAFKVAVGHNTALGTARQNYARWERTFLSKLEDAIAHRAFDPCYSFNGAEAQTHIEDYLEAFRASFRYINVATASMHDGRDVLYNVSIRAKQNVLDVLMHRYGRVIDEWNFFHSEVTALVGSSLNFQATIGQLSYLFSPEGVRRVSQTSSA